MKLIFLLYVLMLVVLPASTLFASQNTPKKFDKLWLIESESPDYKISLDADTIDIVSPQGLTMWWKEKMEGDIVIEYDACIVNQGAEYDRTSDLNCFWMASDPHAKNIFERMKWRKGIFVNCYSLQLYYMGFGGNYNATTRFRRYDGNDNEIQDESLRPPILTEYTDSAHLIRANHWYHIKLIAENGRVRYYIDNERLVDYCDADPLTSGWFGFRTTWSHARLANFKWRKLNQFSEKISLNWIGETPRIAQPTTFGVPFKQGEFVEANDIHLTANGSQIEADTWPLAYWADGSIKWLAMATVVPTNSDNLVASKVISKSSKKYTNPSKNEQQNVFCINTERIQAYFNVQNDNLLDSLIVDNKCVGRSLRLVGSVQDTIVEENGNVSYSRFESHVSKMYIEHHGDVRTLVKVEGTHRFANGTEWLPFVVRFYFYKGSDQIRMVHSFIFDGNESRQFIRSLGFQIDVPMKGMLYNRHIAFATDDGGVWAEPVQPLKGRVKMHLSGDYQYEQMLGDEIVDTTKLDDYSKHLVRDWASWNDFRISQLNSESFTIRKRTHKDAPWIGTMTGNRADGVAFVGSTDGGLIIHMNDFWQSYPSSFEITNACTDKATLTTWVWSPDSEPMDLRHYDNKNHGLLASYEDVQDGLSTPYGIARTSEFTIIPQSRYHGKVALSEIASTLNTPRQLICSSEYLHSVRAFGIWSLPDTTTPMRCQIEQRLSTLVDFYKQAIYQHKWFGFWNYGDVMHDYDPARHEWRYDIGGYAWDNTELASNMWLWYSFLRTEREDLWKMATAMSRHTSEVDVYHIGPNAGLGSRHNVSHWGCGAKEARISQAAWNRFLYYLTADERSGDLMTDVRDAEQKLYTLDPMRLAEPRDKFPCNAPARLRIGPDWLAYVGNWMTEWERTRNNIYRDKIINGMTSISTLRHGIFTGNKALGFDPATCIVSYDGDTTRQNTNHLLGIMGGFEVLNELMPMVNVSSWNKCWLSFCENYKEKARTISKNHFRVSRLQAYAAWKLNRSDLALDAWHDLLRDAYQLEIQTISKPEVPAPITEIRNINTNDAATWSLDAIYMLEVCPPRD